MDVSKYCELLIVAAAEGFHVVEAPSNEANKGNLVTYCVDGSEYTGTVVEKMWCERNDERYRCMAMLNKIYPAKAIYRKGWQAEACEDKEQEE